MQCAGCSERCLTAGLELVFPFYIQRFMSRILLSGLLALAFIAEAAAQTTPPPGPPPLRRTTQQTTRRITKPSQTKVRTTSTSKVGVMAPKGRTAAVMQRQNAAAAPDPASGKGQGVYAAPGEPVDIQNHATMGYDGAAPRRTKKSTTLTPSTTPAPAPR